MHKIKHNCIIPSAVITIPKSKIKYYQKIDKVPQNGDLIYGEVQKLGQHKSLESTSARIHTIHDKTRAVFVFGNRYAPDYYEGFVPEQYNDETDLIARGGIVGSTKCKNGLISDPTKIKVLGYICDKDGNVINTRERSLITIKKDHFSKKKRAKIILCIGTSMNSGKSYAAAACCYALSSADKNVRAAKVTGTASLKDILLMEDCGASHIADFTYLGYPSTYMISREELLHIFNTIDFKYGNNPENYLVIEFADGILQRETAMLLEMPEIKQRIHKIIFCAQDAFGALGGIKLLKDKFNLVPDAVSGICSSSPLLIRELSEFTDIPIMKSAERDYKDIFSLIE